MLSQKRRQTCQTFKPKKTPSIQYYKCNCLTYRIYTFRWAICNIGSAMGKKTAIVEIRLFLIPTFMGIQNASIVNRICM